MAQRPTPSRIRVSLPVSAQSRLALGTLCAILAVAALTGCESGSNSVPTSASQEQTDQIQKAQQDAASAEMNRQPSK
jgi:hypothetical protein